MFDLDREKAGLMPLERDWGTESLSSGILMLQTAKSQGEVGLVSPHPGYLDAPISSM